MRIAICDDERIMRKKLRNLLELEGNTHCISEYESGDLLLESDIEFDIVFLDIKMSGISGLETARILHKRYKRPEIIFVTGLKEHVFEAFDVEAFHYLVKPIDQVKFLAVLQRVTEKIKSEKQRIQREVDDEVIHKCILVKIGPLSRRIAIRDICAVEVRNRKIILYTVEGDFEFYGKISNMEVELGDGFFRCHRAYLAAYDYIVGYEKDNILLKNRMNIPIAKQKYSSFVKGYLNYMKELK